MFERRTECAAGITLSLFLMCISPKACINTCISTSLWFFILQHPDPKEIQINITGFLNSKNARTFLTELWDLLLSAMDNPEGVPSILLDAKKSEITKRQEEDRVGQDVSRKDEELRLKNYSTIPVMCSQASTSFPLNGSSQQKKPAPMDSDEKVPRGLKSPSEKIRAYRSRHRSSSSHSGRKEGRKRSSNRFRRASTSTHSSVSDREVSNQNRKHKKRRHRSRSGSDDRIPAQRPSDSDWRKDLMAGRRRSPPTMPENSYYGYEKRKSRREHGSHRSDEVDLGHYHAKSDHRGHCERRSDAAHRYLRSEVNSSRRNYREEVSPSDDEKRGRKRVRKSKHLIERSKLRSRERADFENESVTCETRSAKYSAAPIQRVEKSTREIRRSVSPEGPTIPPASSKETSCRHGSGAVRKTVSSSSGGSGDSSSSTTESGSDSSSDTSSSSSDSDSNEENVNIPEGPALPPSQSMFNEPEGPSLPPAVDGVPEWIDNSSLQPVTESSNSSATSDDASGSSTSDNDDSSDAGNEEHPKKPQCTKPRTSTEIVEVPAPRKKETKSHLPEKHVRSSKSSKSHGDGERESTEEFLRRRALASLIRASRNKHRRSTS